MSMTVDTLIENLTTASNHFNNTAYGWTINAQNQVSGDPQATDGLSVNYLPARKGTGLNVDPPEGLSDKSALKIVKELKEDLERYFEDFFPDISDDYLDWIEEIKEAVKIGVPIRLDNKLMNQKAQILDTPVGARAQRKIRAVWAGRGYSMPPGAMLGMIVDETDERTERLVAGAIGSAEKATEQIIGAYKTVIKTAISTMAARQDALNAMSDLIKASAGIYAADIDAKLALYKARGAAAEAAMAYYSAETQLDKVNTDLYKFNVALSTQRFSVDGGLFFRNEAAQVEAAIASAQEAGKIAQAAFSSLNTIVSSSTVGFG